MKYKVIYGEDYICIKKRKKEIVYWHENEWVEDPQVVFSICNAIELAYKGTLEKHIILKNLVL